MSYRGVDISHHNGNINFEELKHEIDFVMIRTSYGFFNHDKKYLENIKGCEDYNINYGLYHYSYARNLDEAKKEVEGFINIAKSCNPTYPLVIDMEDADDWKKNNGNPSNEMYINICDYFCRRSEEEGYYAMIYASFDWLQNRINSRKLDCYDKWLAHWYILNPSMNCGIWQYTNKGRISGINGDVDLDIAYKDYPTIIKNMKERENIIKKSNLEIATEIINDTNNVKWGTLDSTPTRKERLENEGYNYNDIQKIVNDLLYGKRENIYYPIPNYNGFSIVDALKQIGVDSSYKNRSVIASQNGISNYKGTIFQNMSLLSLLKNGKLKR